MPTDKKLVLFAEFGKARDGKAETGGRDRAAVAFRFMQENVGHTIANAARSITAKLDPRRTFSSAPQRT